MENQTKIVHNYRSYGCVGAIIAVILSWIANHSVGWCILHFFCGWLYVVYWAICKTALYPWLVSVCNN
jgi:hypothetical protein